MIVKKNQVKFYKKKKKIQMKIRLQTNKQKEERISIRTKSAR